MEKQEQHPLLKEVLTPEFLKQFKAEGNGYWRDLRRPVRSLKG